MTRIETQLIALWLAAAVTLLAISRRNGSSFQRGPLQVADLQPSLLGRAAARMDSRRTGRRLPHRSTRTAPTACTRGEENGEVTLDMALSGSTPRSAIKRLRGTPGLVPGPVNSFAIGTLRGWAFMARRGNLPIVFPRSGYRTDPSGSPLQIIAVRARGKTVTIFIDPHEATPAQTPRFMKNATALLRGLRFR